MRWCVSFVTRQLQGLRYYHDAWQKVLLFGLLSGIVLMGTAGTVALAVMTEDYLSAGIGSAALVLFGLVLGGMMHRAERCVNAFLGNRAVAC